MLQGSGWAARRDRPFASMEQPQQRRLAELTDNGTRRLTDWEVKRARRRAEFAARIPVMAAEVAAEVKLAVAAELKLAVAAELNAAVAVVLDAAFERQRETILDAVTAMDLARVSSATTPTFPPSDMHAPAVALACTSSSVQTALAAPTTCSTQCPISDVTVSESALTPAVTSVSSNITIGIVPESFDPEPAAATSTPISTLDVLGARALGALEPNLCTAPPATSSAMCLDKPEDKQQLAYSSVARPLAFIAASADDHNFITGTSAMPLTRATIGVDDDRIANKYEELLPLKQLELSLSASKELYVTHLLPQFTEAMVARGTSLNQLSGMCSDLGSATTRSLLSPWDPGERAVGTKYLEVSSTELFLGTRRLMRMPVRWPSLREEEFSGSKSFSLQYIVKTMGSQLAEGFCFLLPPAKPPDNIDECILTIYSETVCALSYRLLTVWICDLIIARNSLCTTLENARQLEITGMYSVTAVLSRLFISVVMWNEAALWPSFQFDTGNTIPLLPWDPGLLFFDMDNKLRTIKHGLIVVLPTCKFNYLQGSLIHSQLSCRLVVETIMNWMVKLMELQPWPSWILKGMVALVQLQPHTSWKLPLLIMTSVRQAMYTAWNLCNIDNLRYNLGSADLALLIPSLATWLLVNCDFARLHFQWAIAVQRWISHHIQQGNTHYSQLIEWSLHSEFGFYTPGNILFCYCVLVPWEIPWTVSLASRQPLLQYWSAGHEYPYCYENFQRTIAWSFSSRCSLSSQLYCVILLVQQHCPAIYQVKWFRLLTVRSSGAGSACYCSGIVTIMCWQHFKLGMLSPFHCKDLRNAAFQPFSTRSVQVVLLVIGSQSHHPGTCGCHYFTSGMASTVPFQFLAYVTMWSFCSLEFCQKKLSWDPGIWALLFFFRFFTQAEAKGRRNVPAPAYYRIHCLDHAYFFYQVQNGHNYYIGVFLEQVRNICYLNIIKVCLDYSDHRDLAKVMKRQVPWDPGGSTRHWLEVKPNFKEGGMLASIAVGWTGSHGSHTPHNSHRRSH